MSLPNKSKWWLELAALTVISALVYLLSVNQFSYYRDDWYYAYDGYIAGPSIFKVMFSSDRPARGIFFGIYYWLFGSHPLPYHLGIYIWRLIGAYAALWLFNLLWSRQRAANFAMSLLFLVYPGFLWWVQGIEYQPMVASVALHTLSFALTLAAIRSQAKTAQAALWASSILTGLTAIALVDYAVGMEAFRVLCIFLAQPAPRRLVKTIRATLITLTIPLLFVVWKLFLFHGDRKATDITFQLGDLLREPLATSILWGQRLLDSALNVSFFAWWTPLRMHYPFVEKDSLWLGLTLATLVLALSLVAFRWLASASAPQPDSNPEASPKADSFPLQAIALGLAGTVFGLFPVIMANRFVIFKAYSHYALPASVAGVILVVGLIHALSSKRLQMILVSLLVGIAALTHRGLAIKAADEQSAVRDFWWQVYWRIPKIQEGTTIAAIYPGIDYGEDTDIVWGPANFLYYPNPQPGMDLVKYPLGGTILDPTGIRNVVEEKEKISATYRSHFIFLNYRRVLVMSQPSAESCVHVIDPRWVEQSQRDTEEIVQLFPHSKMEYALTEGETAVPLGFAFGTEPTHGWCYFYQKAELARQQGDWDSVAAIGAEAARLDLVPADPVEWTPFLQAYAVLGETKKVESLAAQFKDDPFHKEQFCENLTNGIQLKDEMQNKVDELFCRQ
ncbi:MAG: hypothetical protein HY865_09235 [Chloroflexi bacterium]|nr:hypothetical protein [Chloroflexota bacterium]